MQEPCKRVVSTSDIFCLPPLVMHQPRNDAASSRGETPLKLRSETLPVSVGYTNQTSLSRALEQRDQEFFNSNVQRGKILTVYIYIDHQLELHTIKDVDN